MAACHSKQFIAGGLIATAFAASASAQVASPAPVQTLRPVEIDGAEGAQRRDFLAGKLVIGRKAIEDSGHANVTELLKREPAVSVSANGRIGLLGLPGYTQILLDGAPPPPGRNPLDLELGHIERIEIVKSALAEFGPYGVAGTINVVTRRLERKVNESLRVSATTGPSLMDGALAWSSSSAQAGSLPAMSHRVSLGLREDESVVRTRVSQGGLLLRSGEEQATQTRFSFSGGSTLGWKLDEDADIDFSPSLLVWDFNTRTAESQDFIHDRLAATIQAGSRLVNLSAPLTWKRRLPYSTRLTLLLSPTRNFIRRDTDRQDEYASGASRDRASSRRDLHAVDMVKADLSSSHFGAHTLKGGATLGRIFYKTDYGYWLDGGPDPALAYLGDNSRIRSSRLTTFIQDDWTVSKTLSLNFGLSHETRRTTTDEGSYRASNEYSVLSPSSHAAWKLDAQGNRRLRLSVARTFRAPDLDQLGLRPALHPLAPCAAAVPCGPNTIDLPDTAGNPLLEPERAGGITLSFENEFASKAQLSLDAFGRRIRDVIGTDLRLQDVPWAAVPRYVSRPANLGRAWTAGLSLDGRLPLRALWPAGPQVELRGGVTWAQSRLGTLPGPDNRLADQKPWSGKLGLRYKASSVPLELNADASLLPSGWVRTNLASRVRSSRRLDLSGQAVWTLSPATRLRVNLSQLADRNLTTLEEISAQAASVPLLRSVWREGAWRLGAVLELRL